MKLQLKDWKVIESKLKNAEEKSRKEEDNSFGIKNGVHFPEDSDRVFIVNMDVDVTDEEFDMSIEALFVFEVSEPITEEFKMSAFPTVNAPAIAFPYMRSFVSTMTLQAGYRPVILPSINFVELAKRNSEES